MDGKLQIADFRLRIVNCGIKTVVGSQLPGRVFNGQSRSERDNRERATGFSLLEALRMMGEFAEKAG
jgi:hypothetical protein